MITEITQEQVNQYRMNRHFLIRRAPRNELVSVVEAVCGIQAQMPAAAQLQLWARVTDITPAEVNSALWSSKTILRTWVMRGTAHYISSKEFPLYLEALIKPRIERHKEWLKKRGFREFSEIAKIDPGQHDFEAILDAIADALKEGPATKDEVADVVANKLGPEARPWVDTGYYIVVKLLAYQGDICFGPDLEGKTSLVLTEQWLPRHQQEDKEVAENTVLLNYLRCYGPATPQDFAAWSGLKVTTVKPAWERLSNHLAEITVNGKTSWILKTDRDQLAQPIKGTPHLRLLPHFDIFLLGHKDKSHLVNEAHYKKVFKKAAWIAPVLLFDGRVIGTWSQKRTTKKVTITVQPFIELTESQANDVDVEAQRLGNFFELIPEVKAIK